MFKKADKRKNVEPMPSTRNKIKPKVSKLNTTSQAKPTAAKSPAKPTAAKSPTKSVAAKPPAKPTAAKPTATKASVSTTRTAKKKAGASGKEAAAAGKPDAKVNYNKLILVC